MSHGRPLFVLGGAGTWRTGSCDQRRSRAQRRITLSSGARDTVEPTSCPLTWKSSRFTPHSCNAPVSVKYWFFRMITWPGPEQWLLCLRGLKPWSSDPTAPTWSLLMTSKSHFCCHQSGTQSHMRIELGASPVSKQSLRPDGIQSAPARVRLPFPSSSHCCDFARLLSQSSIFTAPRWTWPQFSSGGFSRGSAIMQRPELWFTSWPLLSRTHMTSGWFTGTFGKPVVAQLSGSLNSGHGLWSTNFVPSTW
mmetsp:Transcript_54986/g.161666  ORF Transcript_54986/g.161666 Transcript_54986/m.161666 type:complete len:250 (-) Transcript_54986:748-1497(-)